MMNNWNTVYVSLICNYDYFIITWFASFSCSENFSTFHVQKLLFSRKHCTVNRNFINKLKNKKLKKKENQYMTDWVAGSQWLVSRTLIALIVSMIFLLVIVQIPFDFLLCSLIWKNKWNHQIHGTHTKTELIGHISMAFQQRHGR